MRFFLIIPVLVLFLSNVPFVQKIPLEKALSIMRENETCGKERKCGRTSENTDMDCSLEKSTCGKTCSQEKFIIDTASECCPDTETTCVCIYCFQYTAPVHVITEYKFNCEISSRTAPIFIVGLIKDQYIGAPWQPPDTI